MIERVAEVDVAVRVRRTVVQHESRLPFACAADPQIDLVLFPTLGNGRLALSDIMTTTRLPHGIVCNATLWAACIGGAMQVDDYCAAIAEAGLTVTLMRENPEYRFLSDNARGATHKYGVKSISLLAVKN